MKLDGAIIPIEPRDFGRQLDVAARFLHAYAAPILRVTAGWAFVATLVTVAHGILTDHGLAFGVVAFYLASPMLGAVLVGATGPTVFGAPFDLAAALRRITRPPQGLVAAMLTRRLIVVAVCAAIYSGNTLLAWMAFMLAAVFERRPTYAAEVYLLERLDPARAGERLSDLQRASGGLAGQRTPLCRLLFVGVVISVLAAADSLASLALDRGLISGRIETGTVLTEGDWLIIDPVIAATVQAALWLVFPLFRLATFFSYLDIRTRSEGWDLDLLFRAEAARLRSDRPVTRTTPKPARTALSILMVAALTLATATLSVDATAQVERAPDDAVERSLAKVFEDPQFRHLARLRNEPGPGWDFDFGFGDGMSPIAWVVIGIALVSVVIALIVMLAATSRSSRSPPSQGLASDADTNPLLLDGPPGDEPVEHYIERARAAADAGDYRASVAHLLLGGMSLLERARLVRYRRGLTNHDYLRALRKEPERRSLLAVVVGHFDEIYYGGRDADRRRYTDALAALEALRGHADAAA